MGVEQNGVTAASRLPVLVCMRTETHMNTYKIYIKACVTFCIKTLCRKGPKLS